MWVLLPYITTISGRYTNNMVTIRRKRTKTHSYTVIVFDKKHTYEWLTNEYEHEKIKEIFKQDRPYEGILNDFTRYKEFIKDATRNIT